MKKEGKDTEMSRFALIGKETIASVLPVKYKIQIYFESWDIIRHLLRILTGQMAPAKSFSWAK